MCMLYIPFWLRVNCHWLRSRQSFSGTKVEDYLLSLSIVHQPPPPPPLRLTPTPIRCCEKKKTQPTMLNSSSCRTSLWAPLEKPASSSPAELTPGSRVQNLAPRYHGGCERFPPHPFITSIRPKILLCLSRAFARKRGEPRGLQDFFFFFFLDKVTFAFVRVSDEKGRKVHSRRIRWVS